MSRGDRLARLLFVALALALAFTLALAALPSAVHADSSVEEGNTSVIGCLANCTGGYCLNTQVYLEIFNASGNWIDVDYFTGNVRLNASAVNPIVFGTISQPVQANFTILGGNYSFANQLRCNVTSDFASAVSQTILVNVTDSVPPVVTLLLPPDQQAEDPGQINFSVVATDMRLSNCSIYGNWSGSWKINETKPSLSGMQLNFTNVTLTYGLYPWNVFCRDAAGNGAFASANFTVNVAGDLAANASQIGFLPLQPSVVFNVSIFANVSNRANISELNVVTSIYDGDPLLGGVQISNTTANFSGYANVSVNASFAAGMGFHNIFIVVDSTNIVVEANKLNNKANASFLIPIWQYYYGKLNATVVLFDAGNRSMSLWSMQSVTGNIYVSGTDTKNGINFPFLRELGRNTTGGVDANTRNDFEDLDASLGTSGFADSVNASYTALGAPIQAKAFSVFGHQLANVPIVNSTNSSSFQTGILWDSDDSSNGYYDKVDHEDILFITQISFNTTGKYGRYDYEIRVPANLTNYQGSTGTVTFYYELI